MSDPRYPSGDLYYWKSRYLSRLDDEVLEQIATYAGQRPSPRNFINLWHMGGAIDRIDPTTSAFSHRHQPYLLEIAANWKDPALSEQCIGWARALWAATERFSTGAIYLNFPGFVEEGQQLVTSAYADNYARLVALKNQFDPDNFFAMNLNIQPSVHRPRHPKPPSATGGSLGYRQHDSAG